MNGKLLVIVKNLATIECHSKNGIDKMWMVWKI